MDEELSTTTVEGPDAGAEDRSRRVIRGAGLAAIGATILVIVVNFALGEATAPSIDADHDEIVEWIGADRGLREAAVGVRYLSLALVPLIAVGFVAFLRQGPDRGQRGWSAVGALALIWLLATGTVANTSQAVAISQADTLAERPDLTTALWLITAGSFTAAILAWGVALAAFSEAARRSAALPRWLVGLGYAIGAVGAMTALSIIRFLEGEAWAEVTSVIGFLGVLVWIPAAGIQMMRAPILRPGDRPPHAA